MRTLLQAVVVLLVVALAACASPTQQPTVDDAARDQADLQAVQDLTDQWDAAVGCEAFLPLLTDDYVRYEPDRPALVGKQAFLDNCLELREQFDIDNSTNVNVEVRLAGDWAYVRGTWSATLIPLSGGESVLATGKWMDIRERQPDGSWRFARAAVSRDAPLPAADGQ